MAGGPADPCGARRRRRGRGHRVRRVRRAAGLPGRARDRFRRRRVPVVVHEANASAGLANRVGARTARAGALGGARIPGCGAPRWSGCRCGRRSPRWTGWRCAGRRAAHFGFADDARVLLVFGGSQGAQFDQPGRVARRRKDLAPRPYLGAARPRTEEHPRPSRPDRGDPPYVAVPYLDRMDLAYAAADLAICRSGAMTVAEVSAVGLPAVYVPLPIGNGEQRLNALPVVNAGGGLLVADADLTPDPSSPTRRQACSTTRPAAGDDGGRRAGRGTRTRRSASPRSRWTSRGLRGAGCERTKQCRQFAARGAAPGAHGRHWGSGYVGHRPHPAGPRWPGIGFGRQGIARRAGAAGPRRVDPYRP